MKRTVFAATALAFSAALTVPAGAQGLSADAVVQACQAQPASCTAFVDNYIATSGLSGDALVEQLSDLAQHLTALVGELGPIPGIDVESILTAIVRIVAVVRETDPAVADQILAEAEQVAEQIGENLPEEASGQ